MTSTVVDAALALLLVSAGVGTLAAADTSEAGERPPDPAPAATTLSTATATVNYTLAPGARRASGTAVAFPRTSGPEFERTTHATLSGLLADATLGRARVDGRLLTHARDDLASRVRRAVRSAVGGARTQVVADWRPYPGASVGGRVTVGTNPPPAQDVRAARVAVSAPVETTPSEVDRAAARGFGPLSRRLADRTTAALFPPDQMRFALGADYPVSALVRHRYRRVAALTGAEVGRLDRSRVGRANARIEDALARRFERDLRRSFDSPAAAARVVRVGEVRIVVRRWSA